MPKTRVVITDRFVEHLLESLNTEYKNWDIIAYFQEMGVTKILLEKED